MEIIGWTGLTVLLVGQFLLSGKRVTTEGWVYPTINLIGSLLLVVAALGDIKAWPFLVLNSMWAAISGYALLEYFLHKREGLRDRAE